MSLPSASQSDLYDLWITTLQDNASELTDTLPGSINDGLAGSFSVAGIELERYVIEQFAKCFIDLANGPDITGGPDDLQTLAVDHYGNAFARPGAIQAIDTATFIRPSGSVATYGQVTIGAGTIVKTKPDANGNVQRYATQATVVLTNVSAPSDTSVSVSIKAVVAGADGSANAGTIDVIETTLLDPTIVVTNAGNATGEDAQDDATYRETIRNLIIAFKAAVKAAIEAEALTVAGVVVATAIEVEKEVIFWNPATMQPIGESFLIPFAVLYIADKTGSASSALIAAVKAAIDPIRAFGVYIDVEGATAIQINWTAHLTLNPSGANYASLSVNPMPILQSMSDYIVGLGAGNSFILSAANAAMLAIWGPSGTNDLTAFSTVVPSGDVSIASNQTAIPGTMATD